MQKFLRILIIILLFFMCLLLGAKLANITLPENQNPITINPNNQEDQLQILVFVVDDLSLKNPVLTSAWSTILYYQDAMGFMFVPLVTTDQADYKDFKKSFVLTSDNEPHEKTIKFFNTRFKTKWEYYLLLDKISANYLFNWIIGDGSEGNIENQLDSSVMVDQVCQYISLNPLKSMDSIDWNSLSPVHFISNLSIEDLKNSWQILAESNQLLCDQVVIQ